MIRAVPYPNWYTSIYAPTSNICVLNNMRSKPLSLASADDGSVHAASVLWRGRAFQLADTAFPNCSEQLSAASQNRELEGRRNGAGEISSALKFAGPDAASRRRRINQSLCSG